MSILQRYMSRLDVLGEYMRAGTYLFPDDEEKACLWAAVQYRAYLAGQSGGEA